jgi:hypothetical protein
MHLLRALHERIDQGVGDAVEHRAHERLQRRIGKGVAQIELDAARRRVGIACAAAAGHRHEEPGALEFGERAVDQLDAHFAAVSVAVASRERVAQAAFGQRQARGHAVVVAFDDLGLRAPRQERRVVLDRRDELVHLARRVPQQDGALDVLHTML